MSSRSKSLLLIFAALILGLGAAVLAQRWVQQANTQAASPEAGTSTANVVVAARDIEFGRRLAATDVRAVPWPAESVPTDAYRSADDVVGLASIAQIAAGEPVLARRVAGAEANALLATRIDEHKRAISVRVDDVVGVAGFLLPGSRVDVLAARRVSGSDDRYDTRTVLQNLRVLAVDQTANPENKDRPQVVRAVTLEVGPEQAETLVTATREGAVQLTLRNPADEAMVAVKTKPARAAPALPGVTVIRGTWVGSTRTGP